MDKQFFFGKAQDMTKEEIYLQYYYGVKLAKRLPEDFSKN
jgi:hypothetical protein